MLPPRTHRPRNRANPRPIPGTLGHGATLALLFAIVATLAAPCSGAPVEGGESEGSELPRALVMDATNRLMEELVERGETIRGNPVLAYRLAQDTVFPLLDFDRLARRVLGKHWRHASVQQRHAFMQEFRDYAADFLVTAMVTYSEKIVAYSDRLSYPAMPWSPGDTRTTVRMRVRLKTGIPADIDYRMLLVEDRWRIHDVAFEGVSMVIAYRDAFAADINKYGLDGVIGRMSKRNRASECARAAC